MRGLAIAATIVAAHAQAQVERYELGHRLRLLEATAERHAAPEERARIQDDIDRALRSFFGMDMRGAAEALDRARLELEHEEPPSSRLWATALFVDLPAQLVDASAEEIEFTLDAFYRTETEPPDGAVLELGFEGSKGALTAIDELPLRGTLSLAELGAGDHRLAWTVSAGDAVLTRRTRTLSIAANVEQRLAILREGRDASPSTETATARALANLCRAMTRRRTQEIDYPAARLLGEAELAAAAAAAGESFYTAERAGEFWLRLATADGTVACRIAVPPAVDADDPPPLVLALHGAGGSENLFFEGENGLAPALCAERGWFLVATRSGALAPPPLEAILDALAPRYPFDRERVFVVGHSMGAMQAIGAACRSPQRFRAVAALGGGGPVKDVPGLEDLAFYVGIGSRDFARSGAVSTRDALERAGARVRFCELEGVGHVLVLQDALRDVFEFFDGRR